MASTQIQTTTSPFPFRGNAHMTRAGSRIWAVVNGANDASNPGPCLWYSDNDGGTWTKHSQLEATTGERTVDIAVDSETSPTALYVTWCGTNQLDVALKFASITTNVGSGAPGSTTVTTVDAGGANAGNTSVSMFVTNTSVRARVWITYTKQTAATPTFETRLAFALTSATTSWDTTTFTNVGSTTSGSYNGLFATGCYVSIGGNDRAVLAFNYPSASPDMVKAFTFDPTAATPTLGTEVTVYTRTGTSGNNPDTFGQKLAIAAKADYIIVGAFDRDLNTITLSKSINGTSWSVPSGWSFSSGSFALTLAGSNFYVIHSASYGDVGTTVQTLQYRLITASSDVMGSATTFSDTSGNGVVTPRDTGTSKLYALYRGSTASPYTVRSDFLSIAGGGGDSTPPGAATVSVTGVTSTTVAISSTMPSDADVSQYEVRYLTGLTAPATDRTNGTVAVAASSTSPSAVVPTTISGLTVSTRITGRVFVRDAAGNWNTGATFTAVPLATPTFIQRLRADGTTVIPDGITKGGANVILEYQLAANCFETGGFNGQFRFRLGADNATPPALNSLDYVSATADGKFKYESSPGVWTTVPAAGLGSTLWTSKLRVYTATNVSVNYGSLRTEQLA